MTFPIFADLEAAQEQKGAGDRSIWARGWFGAVPGAVAGGLLFWYVGHGPTNSINIVLALASMAFTASMSIWLRCSMLYHCRILGANQLRILNEMRAYREEMKRVRLEYVGADVARGERASGDTHNKVVPFPTS